MQFTGTVGKPCPGDPHSVYLMFDLALRRSILLALSHLTGDALAFAHRQSGRGAEPAAFPHGGAGRRAAIDAIWPQVLDHVLAGGGQQAERADHRARCVAGHQIPTVGPVVGVPFHAVDGGHVAPLEVLHKHPVAQPIVFCQRIAKGVGVSPAETVDHGGSPSAHGTGGKPAPEQSFGQPGPRAGLDKPGRVELYAFTLTA